jgi:serine/threonine protein kinase
MNVDGFDVLCSMYLNGRKQASNDFMMKLLQLLDPLAEIHELGIAHNDICVENIMFKKQWKLIDFDLATEDLERFLPGGHEMNWSPHHQKQYEYRYMFANVFEKFEALENSIDLKKEDVYSLGITALLFMAPGLTKRLLDKKETKFFGEMYMPLAKYLQHKDQIKMSCQRKCFTLKEYDGELYTWEDYYAWLTSFINDSEVYHPKLKEIVKKMLQPNPTKRISAAEANQLLQQIRKDNRFQALDK